MANMEHIINIAVSVDDKAIENSIIEAATKQIMYQVFPNGIVKMYNNYYKQSEMSREAYMILQTAIENIIKENKEEIIKAVSEGITDKLLESRTFRDKVKANVKDGDGE